MTQTHLFSVAEFPSEAALRDRAIDQVTRNAGDDWRAKAVSIVRAMRMNEVTGEDIRLACESCGVKPHHSNAWGAFVSSLIREGVLEPTEIYRPMRAKGSHARKTQVYRFRS